MLIKILKSIGDKCPPCGTPEEAKYKVDLKLKSETH